MKSLKNLVFVAVLIAIIFLSSGNPFVLFALAGLNVVVFSFNLLVRKSISFKPYFLSKLNIFSAKYSKEFIVEIPAALAFEKIVEVLSESKFKTVVADREKLEILAITNISWKSWGENIYFSIVETNATTIVKFDSAALFQISTWGKNEDNYTTFFEKLEDSFTI